MVNFKKMSTVALLASLLGTESIFAMINEMEDSIAGHVGIQPKTRSDENVQSRTSSSSSCSSAQNEVAALEAHLRAAELRRKIADADQATAKAQEEYFKLSPQQSYPPQQREGGAAKSHTALRTLRHGPQVALGVWCRESGLCFFKPTCSHSHTPIVSPFNT